LTQYKASRPFVTQLANPQDDNRQVPHPSTAMKLPADRERPLALATDDHQARRSRPLFLAEGSSVSAWTRRPVAPWLDCGERGPPRWDAQRVTEERARGGPSFMLHAGVDLSRKKVDVCLLSQDAEIVADGLCAA
jgi:hypothetical protein